ncbi:MFS transporter [Paraburkholderia bengalensis]|uniref:MFS transporter n=2 Tax=Paraburkholderia bengalensis TaxID=2747562 RepID=A0ABU8J1V8_9BURK
MQESSRSLWIYALSVATFFGASSAPTPLYRLYQEAWGFTPATLTIVFGTYAFSLLVALLMTGSLSDYLGRKPVILGGIALEIVSMFVFAQAHNVQVLIIARGLQGVATGAATSALGAAILDASRDRGALINTLAPLFGMGLGALGAGMLVAHAPWPMTLIYVVLIALLLAEGGLTLSLRETVAPIPGALAALVPRVHVPRSARGAMLRVAPVNIAVWALGGFYLSLGPNLARIVTSSNDVTVGGWVVFALTTSGLAAVVVLRGLATLRLLTVGAIALVAGLLITLWAVHAGSAMIFFIGTIIAGTGFGSAFQGAVRSVLPLAAAHERAGLMAAFYVLSYLAFSVPAIVAGTLAHSIGLRPTTNLYGVALAFLSVLTLLASTLSKESGRNVEQSCKAR